jgi:Family of unknown function (DUF6152)
MGTRSVAKRAMLGAAAGIFVAAQFAVAHHSLSALYTGEKDFAVTGVATQFVFGNPHAVVRFQVTDASGNVQNWSAETSGIRRLGKAGWDQSTIKPGDRVTVIGRPSKDGSPKMFMEKIIVNGKEWERGRR